jgi:hypothetical protein
MKRKNTAAGELAIRNEKLMSSRLQPQHNCTESEIRSSFANQMETIVEASGEKRTESRAVVKDKCRLQKAYISTPADTVG